jgi:hypothetical protein
MTVVVRTRDARVYVGRCDTVAPDGVHLLDADVHEGGPTQEAWLREAARVGVWPRLGAVTVPAAEVTEVRRL